MQNDSATTPVAEQAQLERFTEGAVKNKIKHMVVDIINTSMFRVGANAAYTTRMIQPTHSFAQLEMTQHEKDRLYMQCEEFFKVDFGATTAGFKQILDLMNKTIGLLKDQGRIDEPVSAEDNQKEEPAAETTEPEETQSAEE